MLLINRLTAPGTIKRIELRPDTVRVVLADGTELLYTSVRLREELRVEQRDYGYLDAVADREED